MAGIKRDDVYEAFAISREEFEVVAGFAMGVLATREKLKKPHINWKKPSPRKPLDEI